jgi:hypothetical protein
MITHAVEVGARTARARVPELIAGSLASSSDEADDADVEPRTTESQAGAAPPRTPVQPKRST